MAVYHELTIYPTYQLKLLGCRWIRLPHWWPPRLHDLLDTHTNTYAYLHASSKHYNCKPLMSYQHLSSRNSDVESLDGETQHLKKPYRQNSCGQHTHL